MTVKTGPERDITLDDVLHAYTEAALMPDMTNVTEWIRRFPQFRQELIDFAASYALMQHLPNERAAPVYHSVLATRGRAIVQDLLELERAERAADETPPVSLSAAGMQHGLTVDQLADQAGLSIPLWRLLDRRLLRRIPGPVIAAVAATLSLSAAVVARYLRQSPTLAASSLHRSDATPTLAEPQDFFDAVRQDVSLSDERRAHLLALEDAEWPFESAGSE